MKSIRDFFFKGIYFFQISNSEKVKKIKMLVTQLGLTLGNPMDYSPPGSSVHGIL